jgi:hypothetical protein
LARYICLFLITVFRVTWSQSAAFNPSLPQSILLQPPSPCSKQMRAIAYVSNDTPRKPEIQRPVSQLYHHLPHQYCTLVYFCRSLNYRHRIYERRVPNFLNGSTSQLCIQLCADQTRPVCRVTLIWFLLGIIFCLITLHLVFLYIHFYFSSSTPSLIFTLICIQFTFDLFPFLANLI